MADSDLPSRPPLDRSALERVLARASELQASTGERAEELTDEQILELGKEVGLSPEHLRQALAEERTRAPALVPEGGLGERLYGRARLSASRTVPGTPRDVLALLDSWMQREECLMVKRHLEERIVWEPQRGLLSAARRVLNVSGRSFALSQAHEVAATAVTVDSGRVLVRLEADYGNTRADVTRGSVGLGVFGVVSSGALAAIGLAVPLAIPAALVVVVAAAPAVLLPGVGYFAAKNILARQLARGQLALEQLLDRLARGELPRPQAGLLGALAQAAANLPRNRF